VLGVDGVVLDGGIEPQAVALLAVVEGALELRAGALRAPPAPAAAPATALRGLVVVLVLILVAAVLGLLGGAARLLLGARGLGGLELGGDQRVVLGAQVDLVVEVDARRGARHQRALAVLVGHEVVVLLECLDLLDGHLELVRDPRVGTALADPSADLVEVRSQRSSCHVVRRESMQMAWPVRLSLAPAARALLRWRDPQLGREVHSCWS
jgi:hypothetical protein